MIFNVKGHAVFSLDAIEKRNVLKGNLAVRVRKSYNLLDTDTLPAAFWINNPDNIIQDNAAAGVAAYGFWFDLKDHPIGPSMSKSICPVNEKLGKFDGNTAHSVGKYGLWLNKGHSPRTIPCQPLIYDTELKKFTGANQPILASYSNFNSYAAGRSTVYVNQGGAV